MSQITSVTCPSLSQDQIRKLHQAGIVKTFDLIKNDNKFRIMTAAGLCLMSYEYLKQEMLEIINGYPVLATHSDTQLSDRGARRSMGIDGLDEVLSGGLCGGEMLEIFGDIATGKTQMCFAISAQFLKCQDSVMYFDFKGNFSATRMLECCGGVRKNLQNMKVIRPLNLAQLMEDFEDIESNLMHHQNYFWSNMKLMIFDSVPMIIYAAAGADVMSWRFYHEKFMEKVVQLSRLNDGIVVVLVNHEVTQRPELRSKVKFHGFQSDCCTEKTHYVKPAMGSGYWGHKPNFRLQLLKKSATSEQCYAILKKSNRNPYATQFSFLIKTEGIKSKSLS